MSVSQASTRRHNSHYNIYSNNDEFRNFNNTLENFNKQSLLSKIKGRENNTSTVSKSLDKFKSKSIEKLRTRMENQINFIDTRTDFGIAKVNQKNTEREKIISNNLEKFVNAERPSKCKLMDNYAR